MFSDDVTLLFSHAVSLFSEDVTSLLDEDDVTLLFSDVVSLLDEDAFSLSVDEVSALLVSGGFSSFFKRGLSCLFQLIIDLNMRFISHLPSTP